MIEWLWTFFLGPKWVVWQGPNQHQMTPIGTVRAKTQSEATDKAQVVVVNYYWRSGVFKTGPAVGVYEARRE